MLRRPASPTRALEFWLLGHVSSDEAYEEPRKAGAIDEDPIEWAEQILLIERAKKLSLT